MTPANPPHAPLTPDALAQAVAAIRERLAKRHKLSVEMRLLLPGAVSYADRKFAIAQIDEVAPADVRLLLDALTEAEARRQRAEGQMRMTDDNGRIHAEQYHQEHDNASMMYRALAKHAPEALAELKPKLWQNTNEYDKLMSEAGREREKRMRAEWSLGALVNDMREADWFYVPVDIQQVVADALGDGSEKTRRYREAQTRAMAEAEEHDDDA